jgi:hypothetical protein
MSETKQPPNILMCVDCKDGTVMLKKHQDTDRMYNPVQWYRCKNGHWRAISIKR